MSMRMAVTSVKKLLGDFLKQEKAPDTQNDHEVELHRLFTVGMVSTVGGSLSMRVTMVMSLFCEMRQGMEEHVAK